MRGLRSHLTYANVIATLCLVLILGGGAAYGLSGHNTVFSDDIVNGRVKTQDVADDAINTTKIANESIQSADVKDESLTVADIDELSTAEGLVRLAAGESEELFSEGPFTGTFTCEIRDNVLRADVIASSTDPKGMFTTPTGGNGPIPPDRLLVGANDGDLPGRAKSMVVSPFALASSRGAVVTGNVAVGVNSLGTDCFGLAAVLSETGRPSG